MCKAVSTVHVCTCVLGTVSFMLPRKWLDFLGSNPGFPLQILSRSFEGKTRTARQTSKQKAWFGGRVLTRPLADDFAAFG